MKNLRMSVFGLALGALTIGAAAQTTLRTSPVRAFQVKVGQQVMARGSNGHLYMVYRDQFNPPQNDLAIARSTDNGATWNMTWLTNFATLAANEAGALSPCIALDGNDNIHCAWLHQASPGGTSRPPRTIRYNRYDAGTQTWGTEVNLTPSAVFERPEPVLAVDAQNYVWMFHGTTSWNGTVVRSATPFATGLSFAPVAPAWTPLSNSQHASLIFDALGRVHITYYSTANGATVHHQWMDPNAATPAWSTAAPLGNNNAQADDVSKLCADASGNVYCVWGNDVQNGKTADPEWFVNKWDGSTQTWGTAVSLYKVQRSVYNTTNGENNGRVINACCDVVSGEVYIIYRDFDNGNLVLARWRDGEAAHTVYANLANTGSLPANHRHYLIYPQMRGSTHPTTNQAGIRLDITYTVGDQFATTPSYQLIYDPLPVGSLVTAGAPKIGTSLPLSLTALSDAGKNYQVAMSLSGIAPGIPVDRRFIPLVFDSLLTVTATNVLPTVFQNFSGVITASGTATATFNVPNIPALVGTKLSAAFVTYPGGPSGISAVSNPLQTMITS